MALVYGVLGLVVILTAGTFGTINSSPWFNLGIAILFVVLALAMFDVIVIDFSRFSSNIRVGESSRGSFLACVRHGRGRGAARRRLRGAGGHPGGAVLEQPLRDRHQGSRSRCRSVSASAWRFRGRSPAPGWPRCRNPACGWCASSRRSASSSWRRRSTTATRRTRSSRTAGSIPAAVASSVQEQLKAGWHASLAEGLDLAQREQKPVLIDMWATWCKNCLPRSTRPTLEDADVTNALSGYVKVQSQAEDLDGPRRQNGDAAVQRRRPPHLRHTAADEITSFTFRSRRRR